MKPLLPLLLLTFIFCECLDAQGKVPLLRNLPSEATSSASNVESKLIMTNRFTFAVPENDLTTTNRISTSEELGKKIKFQHTEASLHVPAKRIKTKSVEDSHVPDFGVEKESVSAGVLKPVPSLEIIPYSFFFQSAKKFITMPDVNSHIRKLAKIIQTLVSKLGTSFQGWNSWIYSNGGVALECINMVHHVLHEETLEECERTWVLGILAAPVKYLPSRSKEILKKFQNPIWKHHVYLEIHAAIEYEESLTHKFRSLLSTSNSHITNPGLEECLSRAKLFKSHDETREIHFQDKESDIDKFVSDHLLNVRIPEEEVSIKDIIYKFASYFKNVEIPSREGTYGKAIIIYLMGHWKNSDARWINMLLGWIETDFDLYRDLHFPFFKADIKKLLRNPGIISSGIDYALTYNEMIDTSKGPIGPNFQKLFKSFFHLRDIEEIPDSTLVDTYKLMVISSLIHPSLKDLVVHEIDQTPSSISRLADIWLDMFPALDVGFVDIFEYQHMPFRKRPNYFAIAHRELLSNYLSSFAGTESIVKSLDQIPLGVSHLDSSLVSKLLSEVKDILVSHEPRKEMEKLYLSVLEVIHHLVRYCPSSVQIFLKQLHEDVGYRQKIYNISVEVLNSGIFVGTVAEHSDSILEYDIETLLSTLRELTSPFVTWQLEEGSKNEAQIIKFEQLLEHRLAPFSSFKLDDLPDPKEEI
ncbi:hypothetical protein DFH28DRAFT_139938 [Melampsora americana]|nr:hypothetical protein DFH28DRAFT_139938 [Melampsora americana]